MKTSHIVLTTGAVLLGLGISTAARAADEVTVHVPFAFIVDATQLPAGNYVVTENANDTPGVLQIESTDGRQSAFALTIAATMPQPQRTELVFEKLGNQYFLSKVSSEDGIAREIPLTQKEMTSELSQVHVTATPVTP